MDVPAARKLTRYAWLSIGAAVVTIALKGTAFAVTGSVGLLSDALESGVNLVAAVVLLVAVAVAARPADPTHHYGHTKAEFLSAVFEGAMIVGAAVAIVISAVHRLLNPRELEQLGLGLSVTVLAAAINGVVAAVLLRAGARQRSIALTADGRHLLVDVWTSAGVVAGVAAAGLTGWHRLDPVIALAVGVNIVVTGWRIIGRSIGGLMDRSLPPEEHGAIDAVLERYRERDGIRFHALRTRDAGARRFISVHVLVPGAWTVQEGHDLLERLEADLGSVIDGAHVFTHLEPVEDPASWADGGDHPEQLGPDGTFGGPGR